MLDGEGGKSELNNSLPDSSNPSWLGEEVTTCWLAFTGTDLDKEQKSDGGRCISR
jgi:hypothetical protein